MKLISKEEAWRLYKQDNKTAHEDWTPEFFLIDWLNKNNYKIDT